MRVSRTWRGLAGIAFALAVGLDPMNSASAAPAGTDATTQWKIYKPTNTGLPGDYVLGLAIDTSGTKWVAGNDPIWDEGGLAQFDGSTWKDFTNVDKKSPTHDVGAVKFDANGVPWVASSIGLLKFDGKRLVLAYSKANAPWPTNHVTDFAWDSTGGLWVSLADVLTVAGGLAHFDGIAWSVYTTANGLPWTPPWDHVTTVEVDSQDVVWIGSDVLGAARFDGTTWTWMQEGWVGEIAIADDGQPWFAFITGGVLKSWDGIKWVDHTPPIYTSGFPYVTKDRNGDMWVTTFIGSIWKYHQGTWTPYLTPQLSHIYALAFDLRNRPWAGGIGGLDWMKTRSTWQVYTTLNTALPSRWVDTVWLDSAGNVWFGTGGGGVSRFDGRRWADFNPYNWGSQPWPFATDAAGGGLEDTQGDIWTTPTFHGIGRWDGTSWTGYLEYYDLESMAMDPSGTLWASGWQGLYQWDGTTWTKVATPPSGEIGRVAADALGNIWLITITGLEKYDGTSWTKYTTANSGIPSNFVTTVAAELTGGTVWVGTDKGLARFDGSTWTVYTEANSGVAANVISAIAMASDGDVWVGAFDGTNWPYHGGLAVYDGAGWSTYTSANSPLPHEQVSAVAVTPAGDVWVTTQSEGVAFIRVGS